MKLLLALLALTAVTATGAPRQAYYVNTNWVPYLSERPMYSTNVTGSNIVVTVTNHLLQTNMVASATFEPAFLSDDDKVSNPLIKAVGDEATKRGYPWVAPLLPFLVMAASWAWAEYRGYRSKKLNTVLGQNVETYSEVTKAQPGGEALDAKVKAEIISQQVEADVKKPAADVRENKVSTVKAQEAAARVMTA